MPRPFLKYPNLLVNLDDYHTETVQETNWFINFRLEQCDDVHLNF